MAVSGSQANAECGLLKDFQIELFEVMLYQQAPMILISRCPPHLTVFPANLTDDTRIQMKRMEFKVFSDAVHGFMTFHPLIVVVIDTPQMQRLRNIKQLGLCYSVFPSASHNRFEHSLGVAFIAGELFDSLGRKRIPSDVRDDGKLWEKRKLCAQIAGLCHDAGHGPFSHTWESFRSRCGDKWTHEEESVRIFDEILEEKISPTKKFNGVHLETVGDAFEHYGLTQSDIDVIKRMILGEKDEKNYLFQVISNKNNHIDVDKWEYITRDSFMLNVPIAFDFHRILNYCCVLENDSGEEQICFRDKEWSVLAEMFLARGKLHDVAYKHTKVKVIEEMLIDAFLLASERLKLRETPITNLTDHIYQKILYDDFGDDRDMQKAKEILRRIECRHLYQCIAQETYQSKAPKLTTVKLHLKVINGIQPYIDDIGVTPVTVHMTKANKKKLLKDVLVYRKLSTETYNCKTFESDEHQNSLKPNLGSLKRNQILLLYKGTEVFPSSLKPKVAERLKEILTDQIYN